MRKLVCVMSVLASPAWAEGYEGHGYALGCDEIGCMVATGGVVLTATADSDPAAVEALQAVAPLTGVDLAGEIVSLGDITGEIAISALRVTADDLYADTLRYIQGEWRPAGEETPFSIEISGLTWTEITAEGEGPSFLMTPGETCADGVAPGGIALSLVMIGGDPGEAACWQVDYATDTTLDLRNFTGDQGLVSFARVN